MSLSTAYLDDFDEAQLHPELRLTIEHLALCPREEFASLLPQNNWNRPRGQLQCWVAVLNRMDLILEEHINRYGWDQEYPLVAAVTADHVIEIQNILSFSRLLLENCFSRFTYLSADRVWALLGLNNLDIQLAALELAVALAERYTQPSLYRRKYSAPKSAINRVLKFAQLFPPQEVQEHTSFLETLTDDLPEKWGHVNYQYYREYTKQSANLDSRLAKRPKNSPLKHKREVGDSNMAEKASHTTKEGLVAFSLSANATRTLSLIQIVARANVPKELLFELCLHVQMAKSFNAYTPETLELRAKLLRLKCYAVSFITCMCHTEFTALRLLESQPYVILFIVDLIAPENAERVNRDIYYCAIRTLEGISLKVTSWSDLIRCLGGNVSHGVLFQVLRQINRDAVAETPDIPIKSYIHFLNMVGNLIVLRGAVTRLAGGGILLELLNFFNVKTKHRWLCSAAVHLTILLINSSEDTLEDFILQNGFNLLIDTVRYEVQFALDNPDYEGGPPKNATVYYSTTFRQANYLRNLMQLVQNIIQLDAGDRLRNLFDLPLLNLFNQILQNPRVFGPHVLSATVYSIHYIIHNEPTAFSILNEAGVIDTLLGNFRNLFLPVGELYPPLADVLSAVCLSKDGLQKIIEKNTIPTLFELFYEPDIAKALDRDDCSTHIGGIIDELGRHYSKLRPIIVQEVKNLVETLPNFVNERLLGAKLYPDASGNFIYKSKDVDVIVKEPGVSRLGHDDSDAKFLLSNCFNFLGGLLTGVGQHCSDIMKAVPFEAWIKFLTIENAPYDYISSNGLTTLLGVFKYFDEEDKDYAFNAMIYEIQTRMRSDRIMAFVHEKGTFTMERIYREYPEEPNKIFKQLKVLELLLFVYVEVFITLNQIYNDRVSQIVSYFGTPDGLKLMEDLAEIFKISLQETIEIRERTPDAVLQEMETFSVPGQPLFNISYEDNSKEENEDYISNVFNNTLQLRSMLQQFQSSVASIFSLLCRVCMHKRQEFASSLWRRLGVRLSQKMADLMSRLISNTASEHDYYKLVVTDMILYCTILKDRGKDIVQIPVTMGLIQIGFFQRLNQWALDVIGNVVKHDKPSEKIYYTKESLSAHVVLRILSLYAKCVDKENVPDLPSAKLYFFVGYNKVEEDIRTAIVSQILFWGGKLFFDLYSKDNLSTSIAEKLRSIMLFYLRYDKMEVRYVPLDQEYVKPPLHLVDELKNLGLEVDQVEHLFKHVNIASVQNQDWPDCPLLGLSEDKWDVIKTALQNEPLYLDSDLVTRNKNLNILDVNELTKARNEYMRDIVEYWVKFVQFNPENVSSCAFVLFSAKPKVELLSERILSKLNQHPNDGAMLHLFAEVVRHNPNGAVFEAFADIMIPKINSANAKEDWFQYGLLVLRQLIVYNLTNYPSSLKYIDAPAEYPYVLTDSQFESVLDRLLKLELFENFGTVTVVTSILIMFAELEDKNSLIRESPIFDLLAKAIQKFINHENIASLQWLVISLARRCFETDEFVYNNIYIELSNALKNENRGDISLENLIQDHSYLVRRNPSIFVRVATDLLRLNDFDGKRFNYALDVKVIPTPKENSGENDIEMGDAVATVSQKLQVSINNPSGIMKILLTLLMEVSKLDWKSDLVQKPTETSKASVNEKEKLSQALNNNENYKFMTFLLKAIIELLASYKQAKFEFLTYSRKPRPDQKKSRPTMFNFFILQLIPSDHIEMKKKDNAFHRTQSVSSLAKLSLLALLSTPVLSRETDITEAKQDSELAFIGKFFVEVISRMFKETSTSASLTTKARYSRFMDLSDLCASLLLSKFRETLGPVFNPSHTKYDVYYIAKALIDGGVPGQISNVIGELDLNFPEISKVSKVCMRLLSSLGRIKLENLTEFANDFEGEKDEDEEELLGSLDGEDETPDLFRNSTLGMYDVEEDSEGYDDEEFDELMDDGHQIHLDDGETVDEDEDDHEDDEDEDMDESSNGDSDIELLGEIDIDYPRRHDEFSGEEDDDLSSVTSSVGTDDSLGMLDSLSEYSERELDGWIEEFQDGEEEDEDEDEEEEDEDDDDEVIEDDESENGNIGFRGRNRANHRNSDARQHFVHVFGDGNSGHHTVSLSGPFFEENGDRNAEFSDEASVAELSIDEDDNWVDGLSQDPMATVLQNLRPSSAPNIYTLFGGIRCNNRGRLLSRSGLPRFDRAIESILNIGKKDLDDSNNLYIKLTVERWQDINKLFINSNTGDTYRVLPRIIDSIAEVSMSLYEAKKKRELQVREEQEERLKRKQEEEERKREQAAKEREAAAAAMAAENAENQLDPVMVTIGDREVDILGTDIDPEFFEALPDDMREEVFTQHIRERRAQAASTGDGVNSSTREIDPDFLDALPEQIRNEILQQELIARRFLEIVGESEDENENDDSDSGSVINSTVLERTRRHSGNSKTKQPEGQSKKNFFTPLVDKAGVAAVVRLLFTPQPVIQRGLIHNALEYLCRAKQTRGEVIGMLLSVLQDGLNLQKAIEKSFFQISMRARSSNGSSLATDSKADVKTEVKKRKLCLQFPLHSTPVVVGCQMIEAIHHLLEKSVHLRYYLLNDHDGKKGKGHPPICDLLNLLDNASVRDEQPFMDVLALVFQISTRPLKTMKQKEGLLSSNRFKIPEIPDDTMGKIVKILISNDCPKTTFSTTISAMQNISLLPGAQRGLLLVLLDEAVQLSKTLISELNELTKEIASKKELSTTAFVKFSALSSDQAKLLRVLTALDFMFEVKEVDKSNIDEIEQLTGLYKRLALGSLWDALSENLRALGEERSDIASALLPLIEALMVVCKHLKTLNSNGKIKDSKDNLVGEVKQVDFAKEPIESLFFSFTDEHKKMLNQLVRLNPNLMNGPFGLLVHNPRVLEFDNKRTYFHGKLHSNDDEMSKMAVTVRREQVFLDSYRSLFFKPSEEFRKAKLEILFKGEAGVDAGGVSREWYQVLSRQMFNPDYALFTPVALDRTTFHPNRTLYINPEHLSFFKFIGRIVGKAIYDGLLLDCHFSRAVYKNVLGKSVSLRDMESLDLEYFKSMMWMLENDITDVITEDFSVETDDYGEHKIIDLIPDGRNIAVTEENKQQYVQKVVEYRLQTSISEQMDNFLIGFHEIIPKDLVSIFNEQELELLILGLPDIDVDDWKFHSTYVNYSPSSPQIQWFWRAVKLFDTEERAKLLQFATGTLKVPLNGFKELSGANGTCKFLIHRDYGSADRLPLLHTCFNQIDLPAYDTYETLRRSLVKAISEGHEGFGLA